MRAASAPAGRFVPARFFPEERGLLKWGPDYAPRFAAVYDLFGDGRTALKTNFSKYHRQYDADPAAAYRRCGLLSERRNWFDCVPERGRHRVLRRGARQPTETASRRITRSARARQAASSARAPQQHARRPRSPVQLGVHRRRPAPGDAASRGRRDALQAPDPRNPDDRSLVHHASGLHAVRDAACPAWATSRAIRTSPPC